MASTDMTIKASDLGRHLTMTVNVTGMRIFWARWWIAIRLMMLAARVAGCGIEVNLENTQKHGHSR